MIACIENLVYRYKGAEHDALGGVSLQLARGEVLGLIGPDGAGKTTLLRTMAGLLRPTSGSLRILEQEPLQHHAELSAKVGYMSQRFSLYEELSVAENMRLTAGLRGIPPARAAETEHLLRAAGLEPFTARRAGQLSGGMKQKLALICAMQGESELLLLDEPGVGVDPVSRRELWQLVEHNRNCGRAIVWATAYLDEAARCDRVCILHAGRVLYLGKPDALLQPIRGRVFAVACSPADRLSTLRRLQADPQIMDAMIEGNRIRYLLKAQAAHPHGLQAAAPVEPNFEEAFINLIGGVQSSPTRAAAPLAVSPQANNAPREEVLVTDGLTKRFGHFVATHHLNLRVRRGEIFGILGANGAGKTTAFRMICGLLPASSGSARLLGLDLLRERRKARELLGYMAQKFSLYGRLTVRQNLVFFAAVYGLRGKTQQERITQAVERFELAPYLHAKSGTLPVGIRQRLSMACATLHRPAFLFLDEPTSGVDPFARRYFWEIINELAAQGVTIIVTTHFMDEAQYLHRMVIMNKGEVIAQGTPDELKQAAATAEIPAPTMEDAFIHYIRTHA